MVGIEDCMSSLTAMVPFRPSSSPGIELGTIGLGDIVRGGATVILAMGDGRRAAAAMDKQLRG